jgi:hypothetical protein
MRLLLALAFAAGFVAPAHALGELGTPLLSLEKGGACRTFTVRDQLNKVDVPVGCIDNSVSGFVSTPRRITLPSTDQGSTGDVSGMSVSPMATAPAGTFKSRPLKERGAEVLNYLDVAGSDPSSGTQQASTITKALGVAQTNGRGLHIPYGSFLMTDGSPNLPPNVPLTFGPGVGFITNGNYIGGTTDFTPFIGQQITSAWMRATNRPGNEWGTFTNLDIQASSATTNYIKGAAYFIAETADYSPSTLKGDATSVNKDAVGILAAGGIKAGNTRGRAFAGNFYASAPSGSDGNLNGVEVDVGNYTGAPQPEINRYNSKTGMSLVAIGNTPVTNALVVTSGNGGLWHHGIDLLEGAFAPGADVIRLVKSGSDTVSTFLVNKGGDLAAQAITANKALVAGGANAVVLQGAATAGAAASIGSSAGPLSVTATGANPTYIGSGTSPIVAQNTFTAGVGPNTVQLIGVASGAASVTTGAGPLSMTAAGANPTYLGSGTSPIVAQNTLTAGLGPNTVKLVGVASGAASVTTGAGPLSVTAAGSNPTYLGSGTSGSIVQSTLTTVGAAQFNASVGFNGATPVGKCSLSAVLPTDGTATNAAIATALNAIRSCMTTNGLAQ